MHLRLAAVSGTLVPGRASPLALVRVFRKACVRQLLRVKFGRVHRHVREDRLAPVDLRLDFRNGRAARVPDRLPSEAKGQGQLVPLVYPKRSQGNPSMRASLLPRAVDP